MAKVEQMMTSADEVLEEMETDSRRLQGPEQEERHGEGERDPKRTKDQLH